MCENPRVSHGLLLPPHPLPTVMIPYARRTALSAYKLPVGLIRKRGIHTTLTILRLVLVGRAAVCLMSIVIPISMANPFNEF